MTYAQSAIVSSYSKYKLYFINQKVK